MRKFFWARESETEFKLPSKSAAPVLLSGRMAHGPLDVAEALHYAIGAAEALREVHVRGRVYAFLQPTGISIHADGVQLVPGATAALTPYFSPEQVRGNELDLRSDIFSLGAILYEMLSGSKAFPAITKPALRFAILDGEPAPLPNLPPALSQLVMRCLEKKPERRVQRMEILLAQLKLEEILSAQAQRAAAGD